MKNFKRVVVLVLLAVFFGMGLASLPNLKVAHSAETTTTPYLLSPDFNTSENFNEYKIDSDEQSGYKTTEVENFAPYDETESKQLVGQSLNPSLVGEEEYLKHIDLKLNIKHLVEDISNTSLNALSFWMFLDYRADSIDRGLTIELLDDANQTIVSWEFSNTDLQQNLQRTNLSTSDTKIFGANTNSAPVGWVEVSLPFATDTDHKELISTDKYTFTRLRICQTLGESDVEPISFYGIKLISLTQTEPKNVFLTTSYSQIHKLSNAVIYEEGEKFYIGESFPQFKMVNEVFSICRVGKVNYLEHEHRSKFKVRTKSGFDSAVSVDHEYGAGDFVLESSSYTISYGFYYDTNKFIPVLTGNINVSNYGKGVWFDSDLEEIEIGQQKKIFFDVHDAFKLATINFTSSDEEILKIVEVDLVQNYVLVEGIKKGDAKIVISVMDGRLEGTKHEETGLVNDDFSLSVVKAKSNANTTVILLWITLGLLIAGLIYLAVKAIIDVKKIQVK